MYKLIPLILLISFIAGCSASIGTPPARSTTVYTEPATTTTTTYTTTQ